MKKHLFLKSLLIAIGLLVTSINTAWANDASGARIYFDNTKTGWSYVQLVGGHDSWSSGTALSKISNTNNLWTNTWSWGGYSYFMFIEASGSWGGEGKEAWNRKGDLNYSATISDNVGSNTYLYAPTSSSKNTGYNPSGQLSNGYGDLNYTQTINQKLTTNGGSSYSLSTAALASTIRVSSYYLSAAATATSTGNKAISSGSSSNSCKAARTATVTYYVNSVTTGYHFLGWYDGDTEKSTSATYTYQATETKTITARFTQNFTAGSTLYLLRNTTWKNATGLNHYAAYFYGSGGNTWVNCTRVGTSDYYSVTVPEGNWKCVIFVAMNKAANSWDNKIYQTDDLMYDSSHNGVEITGGNNSQSRITVYTGLTVSRNNSSYAAAPSISNGQTVVKSGSAVTVNAGNATTGYHWVNWTSSNGSFVTATGKSTSFTPTANSANAQANYAINTQTVTFDKNGGSGSAMSSQVFTYGVAQALTSNSYTAPTGYKFAGWATSSARAAAGTVDYTNGQSVTLTPATHGTTLPLWAVWTGKQCTLTFDQQTSATGYGSSGTVSVGSKATYGSAMPSLTGTLPTAANGYAFMGFYSGVGGSGTQYYDGSGNSVHNWDVNTESTTTLYAYYKKAEITNLALDAAIVATNSTVGVTPTVSPTPTGTTKLWFYVFHSNDNPLSPQPSITWNGTKATFNSGLTSGTFKIGVALRTGTTYAGTLLDSTTISYQVAGTHTVTIRYKCGDEEIKASTTVGGIQPLAFSDPIVAPDIFGYTFSSWTAGDGVTIKAGESSNATTHIKANYDGYLTANYTQKNIIYFKNTLGWSNVYVNLLTGGWWNSTQGTGNQTLASDKSNKQMSLVPGTTDVYYYEYGSTATTNYVSFVDRSMSDKYAFSGTTADPVRVCYPTIPNLNNNATTEMAYFGFYNKTPMFVPASSYPGDLFNGNTAKYYNAGYWTKYTPGTGYYINIYDPSDASKLIKRIAFNASNDLIPMTATVQLEASKTYYFDVDREEQTYYSNGDYTMTYANRYGQGTPWEIYRPATYKKTKFTTTAAGDYIFHLTYAGNQATHTSADVWRLRIAAEYPIANGDYRVIYKDGVHTAFKPSAIVTKANNSRDTVSFFIRPGNASKVLKIQQATVASSGAITWSEGTDVTTSLSGLTKDSVYNICLKMDGSGNISVENVEVYTGKFYIRTDCANSKWDNWKSDPDHLMTYSEYSINHGGYSHYYCHWVKCSETGRKNVKFVIANDYSPCISDTLTRESNAAAPWTNINSYIDSYGNILRNANVRFMWNQHTNTISRAYVDGAQNVGSDNFLYMLNTDSPNKIKWADGTSLTSNKVTFTDNGNWIYEANVKAQPNAAIKLLSNWGTSSPITQYFKGSSSTTEPLIGGSGTGWYDIRVIYDYKTNRLVSAWIPSGDISDEIEINADVMFIREHQGDIAQLTFSDDGIIKKIETAYGVLCFNKWTLNNKDKSTHSPLASPLSRYERDLFYVSFPFKVAMSEVFGFGTYGTHWIIEEYDGANRAAKGYWAESAPNWKFVLDRKGKFFEPNQGYIIALELDELGESSSIWDNTEQVELYFPSYGTMPNITNSTVNCTIPEHLCTINRSEEIGGSGLPLGPEYDRRVKDSHWNVISVPTYLNTSNASFANTAWITAGDGHVGPNFLYEWNPDDNTVTARSGVGYTYKAMHAYLVQYCGVITWTTSVSPAAAPRRNPAYRGNYEFRLEILQNDEAVDQTFVKLSDNEAVTTGFEFNYDLSKEFNKNRSNIYTLIGTEPAAGNVLPLTDHTTVVPVGVIAKTDGDYTFSIPDGTEGIGVTLIDNETGIRTSLSAVDYTINLSAGTYDDRFLLEISPIKHVATGIETVNEEGVATNGARKIMIDGLLYIVKDGKVFDAQGRQVK